jgi:DNA-binding LytR/AlgR family response regulator
MKAVIVEDESLVARELKSKISFVADDVEVIEVLSSLESAISWFKQHDQPDILFMDIQLGDGISFDLIEHVNITCPVVFTTAYDEYAIRAFKVNGIDYLLKPVDEPELKRAIDKCRTLIEKNKYMQTDLRQLLDAFTNPATSKAAYKKKFIVNFRSQMIPVNTEDIACFIKDTILFLYTFKGERHVIDFTTMDEIEELLDPTRFFRANRQSIVNSEAIQGIRSNENQKLTVLLKYPLKSEMDISREKAPSFKKWFDS